MATHDYVIANGTGAAVRSDLNGVLAAIVSQNSNATDPSPTYAYQWWADIATGLLKIRNSANSAWVTIGTLASANLGLLPLAGGTMTGVLAVTAGTAALPGIAVSGDLNTGFYSPAADTLAAVTAGQNRIHITPGGLVGIGTPSPSALLELSGTGNVFKANTATTTSTAISLQLGGLVTSSNSGCFIKSYVNLATTINSQLSFEVNGGALEAARIDSSGRLLVGTSSASGANLLQVNSDALVNGITVGRGAGAISSNTAVGSSALAVNTTGSNNTANGVYALYSNTTGNYNTANGHQVLYSSTTGSSNTANGINALYSSTTGSSNTANGFSALLYNTTGSSNTANGVSAGYGVGTNSNTTGSNNTFIGNESVGASSTANNVITLGNGSIATLRAQVTTITALSDERDKKNIAPLNAGLDFLTKLRPVSFTWNTRDKAKVDVEDTGFIAQELLAVQEDTGITIPNLVSQENPDKLEAGYGTLIPVLVSAVQELTAMVKQLQDEIITLKGDI